MNIFFCSVSILYRMYSSTEHLVCVPQNIEYMCSLKLVKNHLGSVLSQGIGSSAFAVRSLKFQKTSVCGEYSVLA